MKKLFILIAALLTGCTGIPEGIKAVDDFDTNRYLGTWYEVARLDHRYEKGLENITVTYTLREDGGIDVLNQGWDKKAGKLLLAQGKAYFVEQTNKGRLKVSFFGPFYTGYNIIELDKKDYAYSMVTGRDRSSFWILSRTKKLPEATLQDLIDKAKLLGFSTDNLIFAEHD